METKTYRLIALLAGVIVSSAAITYKVIDTVMLIPLQQRNDELKEKITDLKDDLEASRGILRDLEKRTGPSGEGFSPKEGSPRPSRQKKTNPYEKALRELSSLIVRGDQIITNNPRENAALPAAYETWRKNSIETLSAITLPSVQQYRREFEELTRLPQSSYLAIPSKTGEGVSLLRKVRLLLESSNHH